MAIESKPVVVNSSIFDHEIQYFGKLPNKKLTRGWVQQASYSIAGKKDAEGKRERVYMNISVFSEDQILTTPGFYNVSGPLSFAVYQGKISIVVNNAKAQFIETAESRFGAPKAEKSAPHPDEEITF